MDKEMKGFLYEVGMFGTCANPLHRGHVATIIRAACECRELYVVLSYSRSREEVDFRLRHQWIYAAVSHLPHVRIIDLEDDAPSKELYSEEHWRRGAETVRGIIGKPVNAIYCGSDYGAASPYARYYPEARIITADRGVIPISSSEIRRAPLQYWDYLPQQVRPYYVRKVLIIGHESTGKSTMVQNLAALYNTEYVAEYGRDVCARCGGTDFMVKSDFEEIICEHRARIHAACHRANRFLFIDTDAVTTYWYSRFCDVGLPAPTPDVFDLILFLEADVPFVQDGLRSDENNAGDVRNEMSDEMKRFYREFGMEFYVIAGATYAERLAKTVECVEKHFAYGG